MRLSVGQKKHLGHETGRSVLLASPPQQGSSRGTTPPIGASSQTPRRRVLIVSLASVRLPRGAPGHCICFMPNDAMDDFDVMF